MEECKPLLRRIVRNSTVAESNKLVRELILNRFPEEVMFYSSLLED
jgi:phosphotransferase system enzyme I (PtsI)